MRANRLREIWKSGKPATNVWLQLTSSLGTEIIAHQGWDSLTIDLQHGHADYADMLAMLTAISTSDAVPLVRVTWNEPGSVMRALDAGAYGIVCPNIDTLEQCAQFVGACRYAPLGYRSVGPKRAMIYAGNDYIAKANETVLTIAQIESATAMKNLAAIAATPSLDMLYVGPSDLGLSLGRVPMPDPTDPIVVEAIDTILRAAKSAKLRSGIWCRSVGYAKAMIEKGFDLVTVISDEALISSGGGAMAREFKS